MCTDKDNQKGRANGFRKMHHGGRILILPNAWDAAGARVFEEAGFGAIATTSAGIAFTMGFPDGQHISRDEMLGVVKRIAKAVKIPVTADVEAGYGDRPEDTAQTARAVAEVGGVGMNLEDATGDSEKPLFDLALQVERVNAVREAAGETIVLNARTDVYLLQLETPEKRYDAALQRLIAYRDAGADCVFVPGLQDSVTIARLVKDLACPVNILVGPGAQPISKLEELGVARVTVGSGAMRATMGLVKRIAEELKGPGTYKSLEGAISYADLNRRME